MGINERIDNKNIKKRTKEIIIFKKWTVVTQSKKSSYCLLRKHIQSESSSGPDSESCSVTEICLLPKVIQTQILSFHSWKLKTKSISLLIRFLITETQASTPIVQGAASISIVSSHFQAYYWSTHSRHRLFGIEDCWHRGSQHEREHALQNLASTSQL